MDVDVEDALEHFREQVRRRARRKGLSIERLADFAGISQRQLWRLLSGEHCPKFRTVVKLAEALECRPRDLMP